MLFVENYIGGHQRGKRKIQEESYCSYLHFIIQPDPGYAWIGVSLNPTRDMQRNFKNIIYKSNTNDIDDKHFTTFKMYI